MLDQNIQYLKGVGPKKASLFNKLGIFTVRDFLSYYPRQYEDRRRETNIADLVAGQKAVIKGKIIRTEELNLSLKLAVFKAVINDTTGTATALFYRKIKPYSKYDILSSLKKIFSIEKTVFISGTCDFQFGEKQISVDEYEVFEKTAGGKSDPLHFKRIVPIYPLTEGLSQKWIRELYINYIDQFAATWPDALPKRSWRQDAPRISEAIKQIHFPCDFQKAETARQRLAFEEFFVLETALNLARSKNEHIDKSRTYELKKNLLTPFKEKLVFQFTPDQKKVINEIFNDLRSPKPMHRLLMGEVGSGKTVVALSAMLLAIENGCQAVIIAPTEILAEQHFLTVSNILKDLPVRTVLLTNKITSRKSEKNKVLDEISSGKADIVIGTHAVLEKNIIFKNLSLIVIDEQHRFGVVQKAVMQLKGMHPDVLLMTATPIPRTLALTVYGDMEISAIESLPPGRVPIETLHIVPEKGYELVKQEIKKGNQAYIVYPLIEESDKVELKAAVKEAESLSKTVFCKSKVALLHGQMKTDIREKVMLDFRNGKYDILIATTVIEVGIDIPNATVMLIEHADRFGLATLHQLRGRIGRGSKKSYCVLIGDPKTDQSKERMKIMLSTSNGFEIAERDLQLRGPGEFFGTAQSGILKFKAGNIVTDTKLIEESKVFSKELVKMDSSLSLSEHVVLKEEISRLYGKHFNLFKVG